MHDVETRALRRALLLLVLVSGGRWMWGAVGAPVGQPPSGLELEGFVAEVREATEEAERRSRPLDAEERIDPNRADEVELDRLPGIGPSLARAIVRARDDGAVFTTPADLARVSGIGPALVDRLGPLLDLSRPPRGGPRAGPRARGSVRSSSAAGLVDLNRADRDQLEALPGVGPAIAGRILARRAVRPFASVDDLLDVAGIGPATLTRLRPLVRVGRSP